MTEPGLINKVPRVRGDLIPNAILSKSSWFRVGGPAELLFMPKDELDLKTFKKKLDPDIPFTVLGATSNVLIRDGGIKGVVVKLGSNFNHMNNYNDRIIVGGAVMDMKISLLAAKKGIGGMEFLSGIPGTIGGSVKMNAGAYGNNVSDILYKVKLMKNNGSILELCPAKLKMKYRNTSISKQSVVIEVELKGYQCDQKLIFEKIKEINNQRSKTQPIKNLTGGSTFRNPPGSKAWELIDKVGCRGMSIGGARISEIHPNFIISDGNATANDIENLGLEVKKRVLDNFGIKLEWEILRLGYKIERN